MDLFYERYVVVFLLVLSQNFVTIIGGNVTHKQQIVSEVLTRFLKIPWIDLNSSWADTVASTCRNDMVILFESADAGEMWALKMLDAASKVPAGILIGNIWDLGMFDECVEVKSHDNPANIQGQHCMVSLSIPTKFFEDASKMMQIQKLVLFNPSADVDLSLSMSVCVPSSCGIQDINNLVNASIQAMPELGAFEVDVAKVTCSSFEPLSELTLGSMLTLSFFVIVALLLLLCTACDFVLRARSDNGSMVLKNAAKFSLYTNAIQLMSTVSKSETMPAINGIRVISICLVAIAHRFFSILLESRANISDSYELMHSPFSTLILTVPFAVDTSFVMSGFFMTHLFLKALRSRRKFNIFTIYLQRYLRLTPCLAVVLLIVIFIIPYLGSGPLWGKILEATVTKCQKNWWTNLLYVQNMVDVDEICLVHTWYLAVDMQLFWLSPLILYPLFYRPKVGLGILSLLLIASFFTYPVQLFINQWSAFFAIHKRTPVLWSQFLRSYPLAYNRAFPYLVGMLLGYDVTYNKRQISKIQVAINWSLASVFVIFCGWAANHIQPVVVAYDLVWEMVYVSVARLGWSIAMAWVVYACTQGYGGPITKFLSLPMFAPLSRLSYSFYLVHFVLQVATIATDRIAAYITPVKLIYSILGDLVLSTVIAFVLCLFAESPIIVGTKLLMSSRPSVSSAQDSMTKRAKFFAEVEKYLNLNTDRLSSGFVIESITSRLDFWQTISNDLNTLSDGPPKTPTEWSKRWHDWRSRSLEADSVWAAHNQSKGVPIKDSQPQSGVAALEKELMIFLAVMDCGLTAERNVEEADIIESKSHTNIRNQQHEDQHEDPIRLAILDANVFDNKKSKFSGSESADVEYVASL